MTTELTDRARQLLAALEGSQGKWMARTQIALASGKSGRLSPHDHMLLERLARDGLIEMRQVPGKSPIGHQFEYRVKPKE